MASITYHFDKIVSIFFSQLSKAEVLALIYSFSMYVLCSREFTHRVKSVSMAKFTLQEVDALQRGGNQVRNC